MYSNNLICNILEYIDNNINSKITIDDLETKFFYNRYYIMKLFKQELGITIIEYINSLKVYYSILQMKNENKNLLNIALKNGFNSIEYFSETFKKIAKINPKKVNQYFSGKKYLKEKDIETINNAIFSLYQLIIRKRKYLSNKKPKENYIKKLSIFKWKFFIILYQIVLCCQLSLMKIYTKRYNNQNHYYLHLH